MTAPPAPRISVIIPTYRRCASVERSLHALRGQTLPADTYEVIVSVDGSDDGTSEMLGQFRSPYRLRPLWQPNRGRAAACNLGLRRAEAAIVVLLDDDMEPTAPFLEAHLRRHMTGMRVGVMGAAPIVTDKSSPAVTRYIAGNFNRHLERLSCRGHPFALRDFYSGNFSVRRDTLLAIGAFDEDFSRYGNEDRELSIRLRHAGVDLVYSRDATARQYHTKSFAQLADDSIARGHTSVLLASKHPDALPELQLAAYRRVSFEWQMLRAVLLNASGAWSGAPRAIVRAVQSLEDLHPPFLDTVYRLALDYFYWTGVFAALQENRRAGHGLTALPSAG